MVMQNRTWKVGELSKLTGLTIRTLHHYDEIGLLCPRFHTDAGHRLYSEADIGKLQQIMSFKELGYSLDGIKELFENPEYNPKEVLQMQLKGLKEEIKLKEELKQQLQELSEVFDSWQKPTLEQFIKAIELIRNQSKYFTQEQRIKMKKHYYKLNTTEANELTNNWSQLISQFQSEMDKDTPIDSPRVIELAKRWQGGINLFTGGDMGIVRSAERYYMDNPQAAKSSGMSGELYRYIKNILSNIEW
jgi:MerR family transcriptional regulator, thiopeptide resistance regulator